jgi:hypothetical protein
MNSMEVIKRTVEGKDYIVGCSCMMAPCHVREKGKVFKMLRVHHTEDVHFFECINDKWILIPEFSFINLYGNERLIDAYMNLPRDEEIEFDTFVRLVFYSLYA